MFRIGRRGLFAIFGAFLAICLTLSSLSAEAGEKRRKFKGSHSGSIAHSVGPHVSAQRSRGHRLDGSSRRNYAYSSRSKGAWRNSFPRYAGSPRYWKHGNWNHRLRNDDWSDFGSATVVVGETYPALSSGPLVVDGRCAAGEYCTIRLGPYGSSPKIITLSPRAVEAEPVR